MYDLFIKDLTNNGHWRWKEVSYDLAELKRLATAPHSAYRITRRVKHFHYLHDPIVWEADDSIPETEFVLDTLCDLCNLLPATRRCRFNGWGVTSKNLVCDSCDQALFNTFNRA